MERFKYAFFHYIIREVKYMAGGAGIEKGVDILIGVGIGVFVLVIILALMYQGYGQTKSQMTAANVPAGVLANFTANAGGITNTFGSNIGLAVFVLVMAVIILVIILALKSRNGGGFLGG